jgi:SAM-dependent methyltransferase
MSELGAKPRPPPALPLSTLEPSVRNISRTRKPELESPSAAAWNERYATGEYIYGTEPNAFLAERAQLLPAGGRVLCLAEGEGRNAVHLAGLGHDVVAVDCSEVGLHKATALAAEKGVRVEAIVADLGGYELGSAQWDGIVAIFAHVPAADRARLLASVPAALKPGGVFILEGYTPAQLPLKTGGPPVAELMYSLEVLGRELGAGLVVAHAQELTRPVVEGTYHTGDGAVVQYVATKPKPAAA